MIERGRPKGRNYPKQITFTITEEQYKEAMTWDNKTVEIRKRVFKEHTELSKLRMQVEEQKRIITDLIYFKEYIISLIHRDALQAYDNKMSPEEIEKWEAL